MLAVTRAALVLTFCIAVAALAEDEVVDWRDAAQCVGRVCSVRGTVAATENDGPSIRLYFDPQQRDVRVLLMRGWLVSWPRYDGETIVATGKVDRFRDHVEVMVLDPSSVAVLGPTPSPTFSAALPSGTPSEVDELRRKVRELEQRLRELEGR
jgi:hypothetical protein